MKILFFSLVLLSMPAKSYDKSFHISTNIARSTNDTNLALEYDKTHYVANYREDRFDDIMIPFKVKSPQSAASLWPNYQLTLFLLQHQCIDLVSEVVTPLTDVKVMVDNVIQVEGDVLPHLSFSSSDPAERWSSHYITLSFPVMPRTVHEQRCEGNVGIAVELEV